MNVYGLVLSVLITVLLTLVFWGVIDGIVFIIEYFSLKSEYIFYGGFDCMGFYLFSIFQKGLGIV
jgi:hypothetical protein